MRSITLRCAIAGFGILLVAVLGSASASSNDVTASAIDEHSEAITANDLAPAICASLPLVNVVTGAGTINGTAGNDLILGTSGSNTINGNEGADCILGGGGDDTINGNDGNDVIDGGSGSDACDGGLGINTLTGCES
jgi:Ca2+-binding RTX toxin-like protein